MPPLVFAGEARSLLDRLADVVEGRAFLLQAGDCAESFHDWNAPNLREKLKIILQMSAVLTYAASLPVVKVGRIAGQFVKPRSEPTETVGDLVLPTFRGHIVHSDEPTLEARTPDPVADAPGLPPGRVDAQPAAGVHEGRLRRSRPGARLDAGVRRQLARRGGGTSSWRRRSQRAMSFMAAIGVDMRNPALHQTDIWTSHEALLLDFEEALTRRDSLTGDWYDCSAHFLWIGERTRQPDGAHVEFLAGVHNPLGVKLGPAATPEDALALCEALNPERTPGRLTLVARMGADRVGEALPPLIRAVRDAGHPVVWVCDPMHANTFRTADGPEDARLRPHHRRDRGVLRRPPRGGHVARRRPPRDHRRRRHRVPRRGRQLSEEQLDDAYTTLCDPRLNARQSLDLAFHVAELMRAG